MTVSLSISSINSRPIQMSDTPTDTLMQKRHLAPQLACVVATWGGGVCAHEHMAAEGVIQNHARTSRCLSGCEWPTHPRVSVSAGASARGVHSAVQHLHFSATWFQTWKSCI